MKFEKWEACGNDFIVIEDEVEPSEAARLCDRHYGIGADGVLEVLPSKEADCKMEVINSDGSIAEMCGNGIRCVAQYVSDKNGKSSLKIETRAGLKTIEIAKKYEEIKVKMGKGKRKWQHELELKPSSMNDRMKKYENATFVDMGNPHCVLIVPAEETKRGAVERFGSKIERQSETFPEGTNVEFVSIIKGIAADTTPPLNPPPSKIRVKVWERGCGRTLACGTGACASAFAAHKQGLVGGVVKVELDGGEVEIQISENDEIKMIGPAKKVYSGEIK